MKYIWSTNVLDCRKFNSIWFLSRR